MKLLHELHNSDSSEGKTMDDLKYEFVNDQDLNFFLKRD